MYKYIQCNGTRLKDSAIYTHCCQRLWHWYLVTITLEGGRSTIGAINVQIGFIYSLGRNERTNEQTNGVRARTIIRE